MRTFHIAVAVVGFFLVLASVTHADDAPQLGEDAADEARILEQLQNTITEMSREANEPVSGVEKAPDPRPSEPLPQ